MKTEMLSTRIDLETKQAFSQVCDAIGLSTSQAISKDWLSRRIILMTGKIS